MYKIFYIKIAIFLLFQLTIERSIVFKTMDRQCESFSRIFSSALFPQSFIRVWFFWESRLQHKCTWWLQVLWKFWIFLNILKFWIFVKYIKIAIFLLFQLTIERSIVFKTMDRQCESFSRIFSSATGLDKRFIFIRNTWTSSSINENSEIS
jgi:hypothetical protein